MEYRKYTLCHTFNFTQHTHNIVNESVEVNKATQMTKRHEAAHRTNKARKTAEASDRRFKNSTSWLKMTIGGLRHIWSCDVRRRGNLIPFLPKSRWRFSHVTVYFGKIQSWTNTGGWLGILLR